MELQMETTTSTPKPEPSLTDDEHSPLIEVKSSDEMPPQPEPDLGSTASDTSTQGNKLNRLCELIIIIIIVFLFFSIIIIVPIIPFLLIKQPPNPAEPTATLHVANVSVFSLNVSSNCQVFSDWNISFIVKNPKHGFPMFYDAIRVIVLYESEYFLSTGNVESFYLRGGRQEHTVNAWVGGSSVSVEKWVASAIETDRNTRREMDIVLVLDALVTVNPGSEEYRKRLSMKATCKNLKVELSSDDTAAGSMSFGNSRNFCRLQFEDGP